MTCPDCWTSVADTLLACPGCQRLVHAEKLKVLAAEAERLTAAGDFRAALGSWREAQVLLPVGTRQAQAIAAKIEDLVSKVDAGLSAPAPATVTAPTPAGVAPEPGTRLTPGKVLAGVATVGLLVWKLKAIPLFLLTKGKALLLGLTKWSTAYTMLVSIGVYWTLFGWWFALGLVLSIYVHEMGHVVALRRLGIPASAPMFVPGLGAFIRMRAYPTTPREDARVGLAGPMWGLGASLAAYGLFLATGWKGFAAIGSVGAVINIFNLIPVWQLDGSRGWRALGKPQRWVVVGAFAAAFYFVPATTMPLSGMLLLVLLVACVRALLPGEAPERSDPRAFVEYLVLIGALTALAAYQVDVK